MRKIQRIYQLQAVSVEVIEKDSNLVHGDALAALAELKADSVDLWVTDPPYGLRRLRKDRSDLHQRVPAGALWQIRTKYATIHATRPTVLLLPGGASPRS